MTDNLGRQQQIVDSLRGNLIMTDNLGRKQEIVDSLRGNLI